MLNYLITGIGKSVAARTDWFLFVRLILSVRGKLRAGFIICIGLELTQYPLPNHTVTIQGVKS